MLEHAKENNFNAMLSICIFAINVMLVIIGNVGWVKNGGLSKMVEVLSFKYGDITLSTLVWVFDLIGISNLCLIIYIFANKC